MIMLVNSFANWFQRLAINDDDDYRHSHSTETCRRPQTDALAIVVAAKVQNLLVTSKLFAKNSNNSTSGFPQFVGVERNETEIQAIECHAEFTLRLSLLRIGVLGIKYHHQSISSVA